MRFNTTRQKAGKEASLETGTASIADIAGALAAIRDTKKA
jgi:hypothetical protein